MSRFIGLLLSLGVVASFFNTALAESGALHKKPIVTIVSTEFVPQTKFLQLQRLAHELAIQVEVVRIHELEAKAHWIEEADLLVADGPRPNDQQRIQQALAQVNVPPQQPYLQIGGGETQWRAVDTEVAKSLVSYYQHGGEHNLKQWLLLWHQYSKGLPMQVAALQPLPARGLYHPDATQVFDDMDSYQSWYKQRSKETSVGRVVYLISSSSIADMNVQSIDTLIHKTEQAGMQAVAVWFAPNSPPLREWLKGQSIDVLVNMTHLLNGEERKKDFEALDVPVIQTLNYREGDRQSFVHSDSGVSAQTAASFLSVPETWGMMDPIVLSAMEQGNTILIPEQVSLLIQKLKRVVHLRHSLPAEKTLAILYWNYPPGEINLGASHLNVPRSIQSLLTGLERAGYQVELSDEEKIIEAAQRMLGLSYGTVSPTQLLAEGLAVRYPVSQYEEWLHTLPPSQQEALNNWGDPRKHDFVIQDEGEAVFVLPRLKLGQVWIMPQLPRSSDVSAAAYHDQKVAPDHAYMASYVWLQQEVDALVHLGTHGSQEWLGGKDRGLWAYDFPFLAAGSLPIFYPYIQDNIGEAIQAKRRGRAVTISHQTPPFAPAGLYDTLRDLHALIHEYEQVDEGVVRHALIEQLISTASAEGFLDDLQWDEARARDDPFSFIQELHDYLHELALVAMPLGLHTFGVPAEFSHRISTVMQQLGQPFYDWLAPNDDEVLAIEGEHLELSLPYQRVKLYLQRHDADPSWGQEERGWAEKAQALNAVLVDTQENEQLLHGLEGGFVLAGPGGDPIRQPGLQSGRNVFAFEATKLPAQSAYQAGGLAWQMLVENYQQQHQGETPQKVAFSLWSSEAIRHLGVTESQVLHALGLMPEWDETGRVTHLQILPREQLQAGRTDVVLQVTSVYRDQFDHFMRLLAQAIEQLAQLDEPDNAVYLNTRKQEAHLIAKGIDREQAAQIARLRIFSNRPGEYGTGLSASIMRSEQWEQDDELAQQFLDTLQYGYGTTVWGTQYAGVNAFSEQLQGVQAAVLSRSSTLHGLLSTDHPFEYLGGLSLAVRQITGQAPALYISDARQPNLKMTSAARFMSEELRSRYVNPAWIQAMKKEGYAGTLEMLNVVNNWFGWQVTSPETVRSDQWQMLMDVYVNDSHDLALDQWFEQHNPTAQAQLIERMLEAIRKSYWKASEQTIQRLVERRQELIQGHGGVGAPVTEPQSESSALGQQGIDSAQLETVTGQVLTEVARTQIQPPFWERYMLYLLVAGVMLCGLARQYFRVQVKR